MPLPPKNLRSCTPVAEIFSVTSSWEDLSFQKLFSLLPNRTISPHCSFAVYLNFRSTYSDYSILFLRSWQWHACEPQYRLRIAWHLWHFFHRLSSGAASEFVTGGAHGLPNWLYNLLLCEKINGNLRPFMEKTGKNESEITSGTRKWSIIH